MNDVVSNCLKQQLWVQQHGRPRSVWDSSRTIVWHVVRAEAAPEICVAVVGHQIDLVDVYPAEGSAVQQILEAMPSIEQFAYKCFERIQNKLYLFVYFFYAL